MQKVFMKICSMVLTIVLLCNMLPLNAFAAEIKKPSGDVVSESSSENVHVVEEVKEQRTEFTKQFKLSNGLHLAAVYAEPVHYEKDGQWQEIDNTLKVSGSGLNACYTNTAGVWDVSFPQLLNGSSAVSITKDGYSLSFHMSGELRLSANESVMSASKQTETFSLSPMRQSSAQLQEVDHAKAKAEVEYPETVYERGHSRLQYSNVYANTNIVYDLHGNQMKESIVMGKYDEALRGYRYTLSVDGLTPVLGEDGQILLYAKGTEDVVMVMPAPYLVDAAGEYCYDVTVSLTPNGNAYTLSYVLPSKWIASEDRQWPVILDPVVEADLDINNILDATVASYGNKEPYTDGSIECGFNSTYGIRRFFLMYKDLPVLSSADVIVSASVQLYKCRTSDSPRLVTIHKLHNTWTSSTVTWSNYFGSDPNSNHDTTVEDYLYVQNEGYYTWDVTDVVRGWYEGENTGMLFRYGDETASGMIAQFYSSDYSTSPAVMPALAITFRNNNGLENYWDYTGSSAGRAGTGYINNYTGNLVWIRSDIGFGGNRMPVSINHVYNANDADNNSFGMGYGWRTSFNQLVYQWSVNGNYYVWEDSDGTSHYFLYDSTGKYKDEDGLELTLTTTGSGTTKYCLADKYGNCSYFDTYGRLTKQENNQATKSSINITYTTTSGKLISQIKDGVGRTYNFTYSGNLLSQISYTGTGSSPLSYINFGYTGSQLTSITDKDGKVSYYTYTSNNHLLTAKDIDGYLLTYTYTNTAADKPARVASVTESHNGASGGKLTIEYAHNQTTFTDVSGNVQIVQFNNWGNTVSIQDGEGRAQYAKYATDTSSTTKGNQLSLASKLQNTVGNYVDNSSFEYDGVPSGGTTGTYGPSTAAAYHGSRSFYITSNTAGYVVSPCPAITVYPGETYTFSAYVKAGTASGRIAIYNGSNYTLGDVTLPAGTDWTRLEVSYTNTSSATEKIRASAILYSVGTIYLDCIQVEKAPTASRYNLVENGDFRYATTWSSTGGRTTLSPAAGPQLSTNVYKITGNPGATNRISQTVKISGSKDDCFVLAGWAKGDSAPLRDNREFSIIATFLNSSGNSVGTSKVTFNPDSNSSVAWQYAAAAIVAPAAYSSIKIELAYDYNVNTVYFDGIQLYKEEFGTSYTYDADGNVLSVTDLQKQTTKYEYTNNNLTKQILPTGAELTYTYDNYHNVLTAKSATGVNYNFAYDSYGNNTSVSIVSGSVKLVSSAAYTADGNRLVSTKDAAGKVTTYSYNANTNVLEWIQYPEDTEATKTEYSYDNMYRLAKTEADVSTGSTLTASYGYTNDLLTSITTGSTNYSFSYGNFALRSNIKIGSRTLASYAYTSRTNYLSSLDYGNGDSVDYTYDQQGRVTKQTYEDGDTVTYKYDNNGALASVTDSATGITTTYYYDFTDRLMKYVETANGYSHSVGYEYDNINNLTARVETINGVKHTTAYTYDRDNRVSSVTNSGNDPISTADDISETYTYDAYSRVHSKETKNGSTTVLKDILNYRAPTNATTSGQVAELITDALGYDITYTYTYDDNGNILSVSTGSDNTTTYVYDSANQLVRENNQAAGKTWVWTYDNAGNIASRRVYAYTTGALGPVQDIIQYAYDDSVWGDLLTEYDGRLIESDAIGNMLSDGIWTYTWEHGRQLVSMYGENIGGNNDITIDFTYDANGMRTGKTVTKNTYHTHDYAETVTAPTCTMGGYTTYTCACGTSYIGAETAALGHNYNETVIAPSCTANGYTTYTCSVCDHTETGEEIPPLGHDLTGVGVEDGVQYTCSRCDYSALEDHTHSYTVSTEFATCEAAGHTTYSCTDCGYSYTQTMPAIGHNYTETVTHASCTEDGCRLFVCANCQDSYSQTIPATGHSINDIFNETEATCFNGGSLEYMCGNCGMILTETTPALGHTYESYTLVGVTCTEDGYIEYMCDRCGGIFTDPYPAKGHTWTEGGLVPWCVVCNYNRPGDPIFWSLRNGKLLESTETTTYSYVYNGSSLSQMTVVTEITADGETTTETHTLYFAYDASGTPMSVTYDGTNYYYATNIQGDVTAILNTSGTAVVQYTYDAWGNILTTTGSMASNLGVHNPLRYRGYVYDHETGFYYVSSRYYNPILSRFINADAVDLLGANGDFVSLNLFAYCGNNPVIRADKEGTFWHIVAGAVLGAIAGTVTKMITNAISGQKITDGLVTAGIAGAVSGGLAASGVGLIGQVVGNAIIGAGNNAADQLIGIANGTKTDSFNVGSMLLDGAIGAVAGLAGGPGAGNKGLTNIGLKTVKRTCNALTHKGAKVALKVLGQGLTYFGKNAQHMAKPLATAIAKASGSVIFNNAAKALIT